MATQNPIEQEGTYPLPEAQVDRFMLKVIIDYPKLEEEKKIIRQNIKGERTEVRPILKAEDIMLPAKWFVRYTWMKRLNSTLQISYLLPVIRKNTT